MDFLLGWHLVGVIFAAGGLFIMVKNNTRRIAKSEEVMDKVAEKIDEKFNTLVEKIATIEGYIKGTQNAKNPKSDS